MDFVHGLVFLFLSVSISLTFLSIGFYFYFKNQQTIKRDEEEKNAADNLLRGIEKWLISWYNKK